MRAIAEAQLDLSLATFPNNIPVASSSIPKESLLLRNMSSLLSTDLSLSSVPTSMYSPSLVDSPIVNMSPSYASLPLPSSLPVPTVQPPTQ